MAVLANLVDPGVPWAVHLVAGVPLGDLTDDPYLLPIPVEGISGTQSQRFPVPPSAGGFLLDWTYEYEENAVLQGRPNGVSSVPYGAVFPESTRLEPTLGQIWPR